MKTAIKGDFTNTVKLAKNKKKLSALQIAESLKGKSKYIDLLKILEPHELPKKDKSLLKPRALKKKLSVGELIEKNITDGRYKDLLKILEPHEIPKGIEL